jgi:hypothetical protein
MFHDVRGTKGPASIRQRGSVVSDHGASDTGRHRPAVADLHPDGSGAESTSARGPEEADAHAPATRGCTSRPARSRRSRWRSEKAVAGRIVVHARAIGLLFAMLNASGAWPTARGLTGAPSAAEARLRSWAAPDGCLPRHALGRLVFMPSHRLADFIRPRSLATRCSGRSLRVAWLSLDPPMRRAGRVNVRLAGLGRGAVAVIGGVQGDRREPGAFARRRFRRW